MEFVSLGKTAHLGPHPKSVAQRQQGHAAEYQCQIYIGNKNVIFMPDRSGPGLTGYRRKICDCRTQEKERREACQGQAKEKDGTEDGGESRLTKGENWLT